MASAPVIADRTPTLAVAESVTGGLLASSLVDEPGASVYFKGGIIAYSLNAKVDLLGLPSNLVLSTNGVGKDVAELMAQSVAGSFGADYGIATTGYAQAPTDSVSPAVVPDTASRIRELLVEETVYNALKDDSLALGITPWPSNRMAEPGMRWVRISDAELLVLEQKWVEEVAASPMVEGLPTPTNMMIERLLEVYQKECQSEQEGYPERYINDRPYAFVSIYRSHDCQSHVSLIVGAKNLARNAFRAEIVEHARWIWSNRDMLLNWTTRPPLDPKD